MDTTKPKLSKIKVAVVSALVCVLALFALVACASANADNEPKTGTLTYTSIEAEGWTPESPDIIVHYTSDVEGAEDFYHAIHDNDESASIEMFPGHYTAEVLPVLTSDGYLLTCPEVGEFDINAGLVTEGTLKFQKPEAKATVEELDAYLASVTTAKEAGDDTITDDVVTTATSNVDAAKAAIAAEEQAKAEAEAKAQAEAEAAAAAEAAAQSSSTSNGGGSGYSGHSGYTGNGGGGGGNKPAPSGSNSKYGLSVSDEEYERYLENISKAPSDRDTANPGGSHSED